MDSGRLLGGEGVSRKGGMAYIFPWYRTNGPAHPSLGQRPGKPARNQCKG
jgi:hypothetical protein